MCNSTSRCTPLAGAVFLTQTDTTVGFLSQDSTKLQTIKSRPSDKPFIVVYKDFSTLKQHHRVPKKFQRTIRRAKKTTFIIKNKALRVAPLPLNTTLLNKLSWVYSTSANESGKSFDRSFCQQHADYTTEDKNSLYEGIPSKLYKINNTTIKRLR
jgi:tRNA A37 threonylcarbamoyladenosine synthetase subunit TsaC/SUA5/YrdC